MLNGLVERMLAGDRQALSKLFSLLERDPDRIPALMAAIQPHTGRGYCIGLTGPPGAGKSTLADRLISAFRADGATVGVLAVDPTSPFSGGAVLGDRIRMGSHSLDQGVFIRSLATHGAHGGLSRVAGAAARLLDAFGVDITILESVGVGQTELDVMNTADTVVVVLVPEAGDAVQVLKAGLMEIADIFAVNKADREGAKRLATALNVEIHARPQSWWSPPVVLTKAIDGEGIDLLLEAIAGHRARSEESSELERRRSERRRLEFIRAFRRSIESRIAEMEAQGTGVGDIVSRVERGEIDPYTAATEAMRSVPLDPALPSSPSLPTPVQRTRGPRQSCVGIDLTSSNKKPSGTAVLGADGSLEWLGYLDTDADILGCATSRRPCLVAIDAPLSLPKGMDCLEEDHACESEWPFHGRQCERELLARGISLYITNKRSIIKQMTYRAIALAEELRNRGLAVVEVYPYASKVGLFGRMEHKKTTRKGREDLTRRMRRLVPCLDAHPNALAHDLGDAVVAAYTGYLHGLGLAEAVGHEEEGQIVVPGPSLS